MRIAFLMLTAITVLGLAAGHVAALDLDNAALVDHLIRIFS
jgi:hypothetical protein